MKFEGIPEETKPLVQGIHMFIKEVQPSSPKVPMVCSNTIDLNEKEIAFLNKGPRFMMRTKLDRVKFKTELEKMIVKEKYRERK